MILIFEEFQNRQCTIENNDRAQPHFDAIVEFIRLNYFHKHANERQGAISEIFGPLHHENEIMNQI